MMLRQSSQRQHRAAHKKRPRVAAGTDADALDACAWGQPHIQQAAAHTAALLQPHKLRRLACAQPRKAEFSVTVQK